ncbi:MAG: hypothetical protein HY347_03515 [candidate division NC10 bacterium]|nr:hypothetical protein [candidate division NC10 bacterium]
MALSLVALLAGIVFAGFRVTLRSWEEGEDRAEALHRSRAVFSLMAEELKSAIPLKPKGDVKESPAFLGESDRIEFPTDSAPFPRDPWQAIPRLITYAVEDGPSGVRGLVRRETQPLKEQASLVTGEEEEVGLLDPRVIRLRLRYLAPSKDKKEPGEWLDSWDSTKELSEGRSGLSQQRTTQLPPLPEAVEIILTIEKGGREVELVPLVVSLPVGRRL